MSPEQSATDPAPADRIRWRSWGSEAFDEAVEADRPLLLNLTSVWCRAGRRMEDEVYSEPAMVELINEEFVPLRVDADRLPHVQERYIAGGWPTTAILVPTGEVLWADTYVKPPEFRGVVRQVLRAWKNRRKELEKEVSRRRKALEAARGRRTAIGLVRREAADDVLAAAQDAFDPRNGGFGTQPKFPNGDAVEMFFLSGLRQTNFDWIAIADRTLDGMRAGELWDEVDGGFFHYALQPDWTEPRYEKLPEVNAALLRAYALGARLQNRSDWEEVAERTVEWGETMLRLPSGFWGGSIAADEAYYALDADARRDAGPPSVDPVVYTDRNAMWANALIDAGRGLGRREWVDRGIDALERLLETMAAPGDVLYHDRAPDAEPATPGLLDDLVPTANACIAAAEATGRNDLLDHARRLVGGMKDTLWAEDGGFLDFPRSQPSPGLLRFQERPFQTNALAARLLVRLYVKTDESSYRALAERILAILSPLAGRYGVDGAIFALAVSEYFSSGQR